MDSRKGEAPRATHRKTTARRAGSGSEYGKHMPFLVLGILTTILAMGFNYLVYDTRITTRATGNRVLRTELSDNSEGGTRGRTTAAASPVASPLRILTNAVNIMDDIVLDAMFAVRGPGRYKPTNDRIAVIAIDEDSLVRRSSWPWPRTDIARLLEKAQDADIIGLDMLFPEADKTSLSRYLPEVAELFGVSLDASKAPPERLDNDLFLANQMALTPTVLGGILLNGTPPDRPLDHVRNNVPVSAVLPDGRHVRHDSVLLECSEYAVTSIGSVRDDRKLHVGEGFMNLFPTVSGMVRSIPLIAHVSKEAFSEHGHDHTSGMILPSLVLEVMRAHIGGNAYRVNLREEEMRFAELGEGLNGETGNGRHAVADISILKDGEELMNIPLSEFGDMEVTFRNQEEDYTVYPAWEVLAGMHDGAFTDRIVLLGGTVAAAGYVASAGAQDAEVSTVTAHAAMIASMLKGDYFDSSYRHDYFWRQMFILAAGLIVTAAAVFGGVAVGLAAAVLCAAGVFAVNFLFLFGRGLDVGVTLPILSALAVLAVLTASNYLSVGRERRFIRKAFALNVSPAILTYLENHPDRLSTLQGEHRHMTVLFSDIRNFTSISERMAAPDLARFLNEYFTPMSDIVMRNMGTVDKFIGDGMMAFWNAPADNPDHARDAARAALDMLEKLAELQTGWTSRGLPQISIGCGINTGLMFAGNMGSEQRKNYTVMGDNVNIASRLENLNKVYSSGILVTESTKEKLGRDFICRVVDKVRVSGKESTVVIYELLGEGAASEERMEEIASFERVFQLYQQKEFVTAESLLKELVFIRPAPLYKLYLDRLAVYKALPPPPDWDGTFAKMSK